MKGEIFLALFFVTAACFADSAALGFATGVPISAKDYCAFLNQNTASGPSHFYDEKMAVGAGGACVLRLGTVGSYRYQAEGGGLRAKGAEKNEAAPMSFLSQNNALQNDTLKNKNGFSFSPQPSASSPITFLSYNDALQYCAWKNKNDSVSFSPQPSALSLAPLCGACDEDLKSNRITWQLTVLESPCHAASEVGTAAMSGLDSEGILGAVAAFFSGGAFGVRREEDESLAENEYHPEPPETSTSMRLENNAALNYNNQMLTLADFHHFAAQNPNADILLQEDEHGNQTLSEISRNQSSSAQAASLGGISVAKDFNAAAHQKTRAVFSEAFKKEFGLTPAEWNIKKNPTLENSEITPAPLSGVEAIELIKSITAWKRSNATPAIFGRVLVEFNTPDFAKKIEETEKELVTKKEAFQSALSIFFETTPLPKKASVTLEEFLKDPQTRKEALCTSLEALDQAALNKVFPKTKEDLKQEVADLSAQAQQCLDLGKRKKELNATNSLLLEFQRTVSEVSKRDYQKVGFTTTLARYHKIGETLGRYANNYEQTLRAIEALPVAERPTEEEGKMWLHAMEDLMAEKKRLTQSAVHFAEKVDRLILYTQEKVRAIALEEEEEANERKEPGDGTFKVFDGKVWCYERAIAAERKDNRLAAQNFYEAAKASEKQTEAWQRGDEAAINLWRELWREKKLANESAAWRYDAIPSLDWKMVRPAYEAAGHVFSANNNEVANKLLAQTFVKEEAEGYEQLAKAWEQRDEEAIKFWTTKLNPYY